MCEQKYVILDIQFQFYKMTKFVEMAVMMALSYKNVFNTTELYT